MLTFSPLNKAYATWYGMVWYVHGTYLLKVVGFAHIISLTAT